MMHLLIDAKLGLLSTFFSLVKKRLCSPELKHCLRIDYCGLGPILKNGSIFGTVTSIRTYDTPNESLTFSLSAHRPISRDFNIL